MNIFKKIIPISFAVAAMLLPAKLNAQTDVDLDPDFGGRFSAGVEKKIFKNLSVSLDEEIRMYNSFNNLERLQTNFGISYKPISYLKVGLGYALINKYDSALMTFTTPRHRFMFDLTGSYKYGDWTFSIRERLQMTHRTGSFNEYQNPRNAFMLKSRVMVKYKGFGKFEPYASFEIRHYLNAPVIEANYDGTNYLTPEGNKKGEPGWFLEGFDGCYANRYRSSLGVEWKINYSNALKIYVLADFVTDKVVDANAEGTKLKSYTKEKGFVGTIGAEYVFSF